MDREIKSLVQWLEQQDCDVEKITEGIICQEISFLNSFSFVYNFSSSCLLIDSPTLSKGGRCFISRTLKKFTHKKIKEENLLFRTYIEIEVKPSKIKQILIALTGLELPSLLNEFGSEGIIRFVENTPNRKQTAFLNNYGNFHGPVLEFYIYRDLSTKAQIKVRDYIKNNFKFDGYAWY